MKKSIFIIPQKESTVVGQKLKHLINKTYFNNKLITEYTLHSIGSTQAINWSLNLKANSILVLRDIPGKVKALVNLNKSRYQPQKIIILK